MIVREHVPLANLTTFRTGGPARFLLDAYSVAQVRDAEAFANGRSLPLLLLGGGSNLLAPDAPLEAVVLRLQARTVAFVEDGDARAIASADAGASWDGLVRAATGRGYWGLENLSGIPGTVGGAVVQNIGAYGAALSDALISVDAYDRTRGETRVFSRGACAFGYRTSLFKRERGNLIVLRARLALSRIPRPNLAYRDLAERVGGEGAPDLLKIRAAVLAIRAGKFPDLARYGTAGSFFLNPVLPEREAVSIAARFPGMPTFALPEGGVKVPAAWLLDYRHGVLDLRGARAGGAFVWERQPLVLAAERGATSADVRALAHAISARVHDATGIALTREVETFET